MLVKKMKPEVQAIYDSKITTAEEAVKCVKSGDRVYYGTNVTTAYALCNALAARENELENVTVGGASCFKPNGLLDPNSKAFHPITYYFGTYERAAQKGKYVDYTSGHLSETDIWTKNVLRPDVAFIPVSAPDEDGYMSFGPAGIVCGPALLETCKTIILEVNHNLPYMVGQKMAHVSQATMIVEENEILMEVPDLEPSHELTTISQLIAERTPDGACIQMGIGDLSTAIGYGLKDKNDLGVHSEMIGTSIMQLINAGNVTNARKSYMPGKSLGVFLMGTQELYDWADYNHNLIFVPTAVGNNPINIAKNDNVLSVNTALEVDLVGQVVADNIQGRQYSSIGGQLDYVNGAQLSKGGQSFIALTSTHTRGGKLYSNIVPRFQPGTFVTTPRSCVQNIVTEYGCVNLKNLNMSDRVRALISIAHPQFRDELRDQAKEYGLLP